MTHSNLFDTHDASTTVLPAKNQINVQSTLLRADGSVVTAGFVAVPAPPGLALITRHLANGALDPTFGVNGVVTTSFGATGYIVRFYDIQEHKGGLIAVGVVEEGNLQQVLIARFMDNGKPDEAFGRDGVVRMRIGTRARADSLRILENKLLIGVSASDPQTVGLVVLDDAGNHLKTTMVTIQESGAAIRGYSLSIALDATGRIVGTASAYDARQYAVALRFLPSGDLDRGYQQRGYKVIKGDNGPLFPRCIGALPDHSVIIGGIYQVDGFNGPLLMRVAEGGSVSYLKPALAPESTVDAMLVHQGKLVLGGRAKDKFLAARTDFNGLLDQTFGGNGYTLNAFAPDWYQGVRHIAVNGARLMCAGVLNNLSQDFWMGLMKHNLSNGALDPAFNNTGMVTFKI